TMTGQTQSWGESAEPSEADLLAALRNEDEAAFAYLVDKYYASMIRIALMYVSDQATAEDVVQETWIGVLRGLDRFEGRSSLKTWIFTILTNRAKTRAQREGRYVPLTPFWDEESEENEPAVTPEHFSAGGHWLGDSMPNRWDVIPEDRLLS